MLSHYYRKLFLMSVNLSYILIPKTEATSNTELRENYL